MLSYLNYENTARIHDPVRYTNQEEGEAQKERDYTEGYYHR